LNARLQLLSDRFLARHDRAAALAPWGKPCPVDTLRVTERMLQAHLEGARAPEVRLARRDDPDKPPLVGRFRIGSYVPDEHGNTPWVCTDVDGGPGHAYAVADPLAATLQIKRAFEDCGVPVFVEKSGGGQGWHLWVFFQPAIPAVKAKQLTLTLIPVGIPLTDGGLANPGKNHGIEVFPKQINVAENGFGSMVWLPWWFGAQGDANQFHKLEIDGSLYPYEPESFTTIDETIVDRILMDKAPPRPKVSDRDRSHETFPHHNGHQDETWRNWREQALDSLPLEQVYGEWLTGKTAGNGWLECRVPWSPTGDRTPSGGVADGSGEAERGSFHDFTNGETLSVFDFLVKIGRTSDFKNACQFVANLIGVELPIGRPDGCGESLLPTIIVNRRQPRVVIEDAWIAVRRMNADNPILFRRANHLIRVVEYDGQIEISPHYETSVHGLLLQAANWTRISRKQPTPCAPPKDIARDFLAYPDPDLPALEAVVCTPVFGRDGRQIAENGYHRDERIVLRLPPNLDIHEIPPHPTSAQIADARRLILDDLLGDFPFIDDAGRAHSVAALLHPFVRRLIDGCTPLHLVGAPTAGSGKGLLCDLVSICAVGNVCEVHAIASDNNEIRKMITAELSRARPIILLDNAHDRKQIASPALAAALTTTLWTDRIMGESQMISVSNRALWMLTGNNPSLSMEMARRSVSIRIDPRMDQPWRRTNFRHPSLREWALQNRSRLVHALLLLVQAWIAAEKPSGTAHLGSFEDWSRNMDGILQVAEITGFLDNLDRFYETSDAEGQMWREFTAKWEEVFGDQPKRIAELNAFCNEHDLMTSVRGDKTDRSQETRLGFALKQARDRVFGLMRIVLDRDAQGRGKTYRLVPGAPPNPDTGVTLPDLV